MPCNILPYPLGQYDDTIDGWTHQSHNFRIVKVTLLVFCKIGWAKISYYIERWKYIWQSAVRLVMISLCYIQLELMCGDNLYINITPAAAQWWMSWTIVISLGQQPRATGQTQSTCPDTNDTWQSQFISMRGALFGQAWTKSVLRGSPAVRSLGILKLGNWRWKIALVWFVSWKRGKIIILPALKRLVSSYLKKILKGFKLGGGTKFVFFSIENFPW